MSNAWRPAYSAAFAPEALSTQENLPPLDQLTAEWAWGGSTGSGVKVAIIDSGVDAAHPAVGSINGYVEVVRGRDDTEPTFVTSIHDDAYGHGTACAGIIRSLAPECELYSVKVLGADLKGKAAVFQAGLRWAIENGMKVCNLSLGTTKREFYAAFHELADSAYFRGSMLVTAANNMPLPSFPSVYASVISVASHEVEDPYLLYYNPQPPVEFGAQGINVRVPWLHGEWMTFTGNSFAAPHVTGLVARILSKHPKLNEFQLKTVLWAVSANVRSSPLADPVDTGLLSDETGP